MRRNLRPKRREFKYKNKAQFETKDSGIMANFSAKKRHNLTKKYKFMYKNKARFRTKHKSNFAPIGLILVKDLKDLKIKKT